MKLSLLLAACLTVVYWPATALCQPGVKPIPIIFDTDMGNDVDDALALAMLHAFQSRHEVNLLAVTITKDNKWAAPWSILSTVIPRSPSALFGTERHQNRIP